MFGLSLRKIADPCAEPDDVKRTLQSLSLGRKRVLKKQRETKDVDVNEEFSWDKNFTDPSFKIHISSITETATVRLGDDVDCD